MANEISAADLEFASDDLEFADAVAQPPQTEQPGVFRQAYNRVMESPTMMPLRAGIKAGEMALEHPAATGALIAGAATGGAGLIPSAIATGLGAASGAALQQAMEKDGEQAAQAKGPFLPGMVSPGMPQPNPDILKSVEKAVNERSIGTGLEAAATSLGIGAGIKAVAKTAPYAISYLSEVPVPTIKRVIERGLKIIGVGSREAEVGGAVALKETQDAIKAARSAAGVEVRDAAIGLHKQVKGARVVDLSKTRTALAQVMRDANATDPRIMAMGGDGLMTRLRGLASKIKDMPNASPIEAWKIRQSVDDFIEWTRGPLAEPVRDVSQRAAKAMRAAIAQSIDDAGVAAKYTKLSDANAAFSALDDAIDNSKIMFRTPDQSEYALGRRFVTLAKEWNRDGAQAQAIENIRSAIPGSAKSVDKLIDQAAIREIVQVKPSNTLEWGKLDRALRAMSKYLPAAARPARVAAKGVQVGGSAGIAGLNQ